MNLPLRFVQYAAPAAVALISLVFLLLEPTSSELLAYQREGVASGQVWRLISANLVHTNAAHFYLNLAGVALLWAIHGFYYSISNYFLQILGYSIVVTLGIYIFSQDMLWYAGLSGVLHGIFVWGAFCDIKHKVKFGWILMLGVWLKIAFEQFFGQDQHIANLIGADVAVDAHLYGAVAGVFFIFTSILKNKYSPQR